MLLALTDEWDPATPLQASTSTTIGGRTYIYSYVGQEMYQLYGKDYTSISHALRRAGKPV